ncbi:Uu.00g105920.m01.CDS01 [Anthostomella pinea]|uniref:Uu.00g105920.m01.CDS01 n=1 Tax=Anthostomella pinea TaxID=933095 RepID=A0AAI8VE30_9PEZI|nr:Uu.00g105920.m01.CDS01 [Anthostomella pinea]
MFETYLRTFRLLAQSSGRGLYRQTALVPGSQTFTRNFASRSQQGLGLPASRTAKHATPRPRIANAVAQSKKLPSRTTRRSFHNTSRLRDSKPTPSNSGNPTAQEPQGLSARLKKLSREYGWSALGVYLGLSVLDFPFCFLLVRIVGTDRIGQFEHWIVSNAKKLIPDSVQDKWHEYRDALKQAEVKEFGNDDISEHVEMAGWGVQEAEERNKTEASLGTQLALAYAIHKSFIFIRVPLTAAITPKVVKVLRSWGWDIGKRRAKR